MQLTMFDQPEAKQSASSSGKTSPASSRTKGNAFGRFLAALVGESDALLPAGGKWTDAGCVYGPRRTVAWRVLDAQYFGLAQQRRRVFVVASARTGFDPAAVLFESEGVRRDHPPRRGKGENPTSTIAGGARKHGGYSTDDIPLTTVSLRAQAQSSHREDSETFTPVAFGGNNQVGPIDVATARNACASASASGRMDFESETFVVHGTQDPCTSDKAFALGRNNGQENAVLAFSCKDYGGDASNDLAPTLRAMGHGESHANAGGQVAVCVTGEVTHTLKADGFDGSEDGTGRGQPIVFDPTQITSATNRSNPQPGDPCHTLAKGQQPPTLVSSSVRRLTPRETERLQGFNDVTDRLRIIICRNEEEKTGFAKCAEQGSIAQKAEQSAPVAAHVLIDYGQQLLQLRSAGRLLWSVTIADASVTSPLPLPIADFARLVAATKLFQEMETDAGRAELQPNTSDFIAQPNGNWHVLLCGQEIEELAGDAERFTDVLSQCMKSITSRHGQARQNFALTLQTLSCCVAAAINGFTPERTTEACFSLLIETLSPYTLIPWRGKPAEECPDGPRYKAIGNSKAVSVVRWIGQRIQRELERTQ